MIRASEAAYLKLAALAMAVAVLPPPMPGPPVAEEKPLIEGETAAAGESDSRSGRGPEPSSQPDKDRPELSSAWRAELWHRSYRPVQPQKPVFESAIPRGAREEWCIANREAGPAFVLPRLIVPCSLHIMAPSKLPQAPPLSA